MFITNRLYIVCFGVLMFPLLSLASITYIGGFILVNIITRISGTFNFMLVF
jgi:hypothetical protein